MKVKATRFKDRDALLESTRPGGYCFSDFDDGEFIVHGMWFICPCGCGQMCWLAIGEDNPHPRWTWNGDKDKPTLKPSIFNTGLPCKWHGFLTDGEFRSV